MKKILSIVLIGMLAGSTCFAFIYKMGFVDIEIQSTQQFLSDYNSGVVGEFKAVDSSGIKVNHIFLEPMHLTEIALGYRVASIDKAGVNFVNSSYAGVFVDVRYSSDKVIRFHSDCKFLVKGHIEKRRMHFDFEK